MKWPSVEQLTSSVPLPSGYTYALPTHEDTPSLIRAVDESPRVPWRLFGLSQAATAVT